jgi:hypothetical protein
MRRFKERKEIESGKKPGSRLNGWQWRWQHKSGLWFNFFWKISWPFGILLPFRCILWALGIYCGHFGTLFPVWVCCTKENLTTL